MYSIVQILGYPLCYRVVPYLMMFSYSLSLPFESFHLRYMTEASTLAGLYVFGSFRRLTTDKSIVLKIEMRGIIWKYGHRVGEVTFEM